MSGEWLVDINYGGGMEMLVTTFAVPREEESRANSIISATALAKVSRPRYIRGGSAVKIRFVSIFISFIPLNSRLRRN